VTNNCTPLPGGHGKPRHSGVNQGNVAISATYRLPESQKRPMVFLGSNPTLDSEIFMKRKTLFSIMAPLSLFLLVAAGQALADEHAPAHFTGLLNDYSPAAVKGGPWEMHGQWTLDLHREHDSVSADFYAVMTMSGYASTGGAPDGTKGGQGAHTHHIKLTKVTVTWSMDNCPTFSPATTMGFQINGTVSLITGNGGMAPFETSPPSSSLQVCVTGASEVPYSNLSLVFGGPATTHFGTQAIHGVVRKASGALR
jgi:hypothetical protein